MKKISTLLLFLLPMMGLFAQSSLNNLGFPSPNNNFLQQVSGSTDVGVDLYTGAAQVNIPICALSSKETSIPVSLSYVGGRGIRVQDYATCVGLGWQLNAGGSISRIVRGFPDELSNGYIGAGQWGKKVKPYLADGAGLSAADYTAITGWNSSGYVGPTADGEPDIYFIKTPSINARFTFDENGTAVFTNETGLKITPLNFINSGNYANSTFIVADPEGNSYSFGAEREGTTTTLYGGSYTFTTTWYLSELNTFNGKDKVTFNYITAPNNDVLDHYQWSRSYSSGCQTDDPSTSLPVSIVQPKYISSIVCPNGQIDFNYVYDRTDIPTAARLSSVTLKGGGTISGTVLKTFNFDVGYFNSSSTDPKLLRLKLNAISIAGGTTSTATPLPYRTFTYYMAQNLPARNSQNFDYWGYFKAITGDPMADPTLRTPNEENTKANILTSIAELGGAVWSVSYESNTYNKATNNVPVGGLRVKAISKNLPSGEMLQTQYDYNDASGKSTGQVLTEGYNLFVINAISGGCTLLAQKVVSESPVNIYDLNGTFVGYSSVKTILPNGGYTVQTFQNFSDFGDVFSSATICGDVAVPTMTSSISFAYKRGLPKSIISYNSANEKISEDIHTYSGLSSPTTKSAWSFRPYVASAYCSGNGGMRDISSAYYINIENYRLTSSIHRDYDQLTPSNHIQTTTNFTYCANKRTIQSVSTTDSKNNTVVKTVYHAHDTGIPMITAAEQSVLASMQPLNNIDALVHETNDKNGAISQVHYVFNSPPVAPSNTPKYFVKDVNYYRGSTLLSTKSFVTELNQSNAVSEKYTGGSTGSVLYGYNDVYPVAEVVNAETSITSNQGTGSFSHTFNSPFTQTFITDFMGTVTLQISGTSLPSNVSVSYSLSGPDNRSGSVCLGTSPCNTTQTVTLTNIPAGTYTLLLTPPSPVGSSYFFFQVSFPVTSPGVAREFFYEGFEEVMQAKSGNAHTGNKYLATGSYNVPFVIPNSRPYLIQWWNWVNGKWVFNQATYTGPITLSGVVDDIRVFPKDALMTTYAYNPQIGKTGQIDPAGRTVTYEYDGLERLNIVRDNDKNILSKNCYNYAGIAVDCPAATVYTNTARSQVFTRNNCGAGYLGTQVTYVVPAGTYSSSISAADADEQALNDIITNGQAYANTQGICYQVWYNVQKSGSFTRNNCGSSSTGSTVSYTVAAGTYSSTISQADADQKAQNDVNTNGQTFANANGVCTPIPCSLTTASGYSMPSKGISNSGGTISFYMTFWPTSSTMFTVVNYHIATIEGGCRPSAVRSVNVTTGGRNWTINIYPNGRIEAIINSGSSVPPSNPVTFSNVTFPQ